MKNKLTERWKNDSLWREKWEVVMKCFLSSENIGKFDNSYYLPNGYLDLRGFDFNERVDFAKYTDKDYSSLIRETFGIIKNKKFENVEPLLILYVWCQSAASSCLWEEPCGGNN